MGDGGIYGLTDQEVGEVRYIGRAFDIEKRYAQHMGEGRRAARLAVARGWLETPIIRTKLNWLAYMHIEERPVGVVILEEVQADLARQTDRELYWARRLSELGIPLANGTNSGAQIGIYLSKGQCPYTQGLPTKDASEITPPDGLLHPPYFGTVIPVSALRRSGGRPHGTSRAYALQRLSRDAPELHAEVLGGRLTAHKAMVQAGFRARKLSVRLDDPEAAARALKANTSPEFIADLRRLLDE